MLSKTFGKNVFTQLILGAYFVIALTLPLNKITLSLACIWLLVILVLEGDFKRYYQTLKNSNPAKIMVSLVVWTLISFTWSDDLNWAWKDFVVKLPFYLLPLIFIIQPIQEKKQLKLLLICFVAAVGITSIINFVNFFIGSISDLTSDTRTMSLFLSHIRFSLMINCAAVIAYFWFRSKESNYSGIGLLLFIWFCIYTYYSQVLTGVITLLVVLASICIYELLQLKNKKITRIIFTLGIIGVSITGFQFMNFLTKQEQLPKLSSLPTHTAKGNPYYHDLNSQFTENGNFTFLYLNEEELADAWSQRSEIPYEGTDKKQQAVKYTLIRYLTSKNLPKDAAGVEALSKQDIQSIESGIPSVLYFKKGLKGRLYELKNELMFSNDPNGHSIGQRIHYWKTGWEIFKQSPIIGIGNGDIVEAFKNQYAISNSPLTKENQLRTHNQFLTFAISLGLIGLALFVALIVVFFQTVNNNKMYVGTVILLILLISCFVEDTLETQMGVTLFGFFYGLFISLNLTTTKQAMETTT